MICFWFATVAPFAITELLCRTYSSVVPFCTALGGAIGDPMDGSLFDLARGYRPLFFMMASYTMLAFISVLLVPRGAGEAGTGPDAGGY